LREYRQWLDRKYGGLDGLNQAWLRRYGEWDDVRPGKFPSLPFTENMSFAHFTTWRACEHARQRYEVIKGLDPRHPVTVHGGGPSADYTGSERDSALNRGNDWFFADRLDGVGTSSFPKWAGIDDAEFGSRVEFVKSAARGKRVWLSELQGGRSAQGFDVHESVDALSQQRWIWNGVACGADTILFWCWRDEVFCREAGGFGLIGKDGLAEERLAAMRRTGNILAENAGLIDGYRPTPGRVGVLFSPQSYYLQWSSTYFGKECRDALCGYARALVKRSIPYTVVEEEHLDALDGLTILFLPRVIATDEALERRLEAFVKEGGTLVCESETGAFSPEGIYREESRRFTARLAGIEEIGRRKLRNDWIATVIDGRELRMDATPWLTPWQRGRGEILADSDEGAAIVDVPVGKGRLVLCGSYLGQPYYTRECGKDKGVDRSRTGDFERFVEATARRAGWLPEVEVLAPAPEAGRFLYVKTGESGGRKVVFVFFQEGHREARLRFAPGFIGGGAMKDLMTGGRYVLVSNDAGKDLTLPAGSWRFAVLVEELTVNREVGRAGRQECG
jgi:beta-galactosidase